MAQPLLTAIGILFYLVKRCPQSFWPAPAWPSGPLCLSFPPVGIACFLDCTPPSLLAEVFILEELLLLVASYNDTGCMEGKFCEILCISKHLVCTLREDNFALDFPRLCPLPSNFYLLWRVPEPFWLLTVSKWPASIVRTLSVPIILNLNRDLLWGRAIFSQCAGLPEGSFNTHSSVVETFLGLIPWWLRPLPVFFLWSFFPGSYDLINRLSVWSSFFSISNFWGSFLFYFYRDFLTCAFHSLSWEFFFFLFPFWYLIFNFQELFLLVCSLNVSLYVSCLHGLQYLNFSDDVIGTYVDMYFSLLVSVSSKLFKKKIHWGFRFYDTRLSWDARSALAVCKRLIRNSVHMCGAY